EAYARALQRLGVVSAADLPRHIAGGGNSRIKLAGVVTARQERTTSRGSRMAYLTLSDASGQFECTVFSAVLNASRDLIEGSAPILLTVEVQVAEDQTRVTGVQVQSLDKAAAGATAALKVFVAGETPLASLKDLVGREAKGRGRIAIVARDGERE